MGIQLTKEQLKPVNSNCKINVVLSVPGSGKSTVLLSRAERLWHETREPILMVTFSNDAANSLFKRVAPEIKTQITIRTIHAFCYDLIKQYWSDLGEIIGGDNWPSTPTILSQDQEIALISETFTSDNTKQLFDTFTYLKNLSASPETLLGLYKKKVYFEKVRQSDLEKYIYYVQERRSRGLINFDDMIELAESLTPLPYVATDLSRRFSHVLIDEAQDTSESQWKVLRPMILGASTNLVVGDVNQAVYGWRGADGSILINMSRMKEAVTFRLSQSFRSGANIATLANKLVYDKSSQIVPKNHLDAVNIFKFNSIEEEVSWVLSNIKPETAIISRTNSYLERFEKACIDNGIKYSGKSFYRSNHINELYTYLKDYKGSDVLPLIEKAYVLNSSYTKSQMDDFKLIYSMISKNGLPYFYSIVEKARELEGGDITLTTGHASKGLEWTNVVVVGCHTGHVPHKASNDDREERNLLYVMTSRAEEDLKITCVGEPSIYFSKDVVKSCRNPLKEK